ncbi:hypothetical protein RBSH_02662 [Rhodopirellula baltica SH28]|uniref:Uncharacterized protein n=2 Tax=Rhodopirellula baltica TaxID=265606 RepID=K5CE48_RHOBT|nr:hypothetical protein RBSH_02662 [Rhodopirellula baltica SH28]
MTNRTKRLLVIFAVLSITVCSIAGWATVKVVAWARDLPNRIVIDGDAIATTVGAAYREMYHEALQGGDTALQTQILRDQFAPAVAEHPDAAAWIRDEYRDDIILLVESEDPVVSSTASKILTSLPPVADSPSADTGG